MGAVNVTVRVDEETKKEFDTFCENVGINITTAFNMFIKATLRTRELPFTVTDNRPRKDETMIEQLAAMDEFIKAVKASDEAVPEFERVKLREVEI